MIRFMLAPVVAASLVFGAALLAAQPQEGSGPPKPGKEHELLKEYVGEWDVVGKMFMPDGKVETSKGKDSTRLACGGLWVISDFQGEMMGAPFTGHGVFGYDSSKKEYVGTWVDSWVDYLIPFTGGKAEGKTLTYTMEQRGPDGKVAKVRQVREAKDADHHVMTFYFPGPDGKEAPGMILEYTRKK